MNFVLIGSNEYIVPRHIKTIKEFGDNIIGAVDPHDCVGILGEYFPFCSFYRI